MGYTFLALALGVALFFALIGMQAYGLRYGRSRASHGEAGRAGLGSVEAAIYGLLGLLLAFSFSGAASRFEHRHGQVVDEANAIGTAYLRIDLLPESAQPGLREAFRRYADARLAVYRLLPDVDAARAELARATAIQGEIWTQAIAGVRGSPGPASVSVLSALNEMFDIANTRTASAYTHPPPVLFVMLVLLALAAAFLVGHGMAESPAPSRLHMIAYAAALAIVVYVVVDLEFPRMGLIRLGGADRFLAEARAAMK
jgi:hypothetical protein